MSETTPLLPEIIEDPSTGTPGIVANELMQEEQLTKVYSSSRSTGSLASSDGEYAVPSKQLYVIISSLFMCSYLSALDTTVVTTLLSTISSDLEEMDRSSWIATSYLLSCCAFQPLFGKISDIFGRKVMILLCIVSFAIGCLISSYSYSLWPLVISRYLAGIGAGGMSVLGTVAMSDLISLRKRGVFQGGANIFYGLGSASGGVIGGLIADNWGWRAVFSFQVPIALCCATAITICFHLPEGSPGNGYPNSDMWKKFQSIDFAGSILLATSLTGLVAAAALGGHELPYGSASFILLVVISLGLLAWFAYIELHSEQPAIPIELLNTRTVLSACLANWFYSISVYSYMYYIPIYFTTSMDFSPTDNGLRMIPNFFGIAFGSVGSGIYMRKTGKYLKFIAVTCLLGVLGTIRICFINPDISLFTQFTLTVVPGFGYSCMLTVTLLALIASVPMEKQASTTSIQYAFRSTGSTIGVSLAAAIFRHGLSTTLGRNVSNALPDTEDPKIISEILQQALKSTDYIKEAPKWAIEAIRSSYDFSCHLVFYFCLITVTMGYVSVMMMREHKLHTSVNRE